MNEHYSAFIDLGRRIAGERGVNWNVRLQADGIAVPEDAWNITEFVGDSPPPVHWVRDFGLDAKALQALNERRAQQGVVARLDGSSEGRYRRTDFLQKKLHWTRHMQYSQTSPRCGYCGRRP